MKKIIKKNKKQFLVKISSRIDQAYQFKILCLILSKASVTIRTLARKMKTIMAFFVYPWQWISSRHDLLYIKENLGCIMFSWLNCCIKQKIRKRQPTKTLVQIESFKLSIYRKKLFGNIKVYIPYIFHIFHIFHIYSIYHNHLSLLSPHNLIDVFRISDAQRLWFSSITKCCVHFSASFVLSERAYFCKNHVIK